MTGSGEFETRRQAQRVTWMRDMLTDRFADLLRSDPAVATRVRELEHDVGTGRLTPPLAVAEIMQLVGLGASGSATD
jgi:LAO/AO transport system kinase